MNSVIKIFFPRLLLSCFSIALGCQVWMAMMRMTELFENVNEIISRLSKALIVVAFSWIFIENCRIYFRVFSLEISSINLLGQKNLHSNHSFILPSLTSCSLCIKWILNLSLHNKDELFFKLTNYTMGRTQPKNYVNGAASANELKSHDNDYDFVRTLRKL